MPLLSIVLTLVVIGVLLWLINNYIPMQGTIKSILNAVVVICVVVWLLYAFGIISHSGDIHLPRVNAS
jgi:1-acyl-sn-glycerol-3-phosphate acyltransferase